MTSPGCLSAKKRKNRLRGSLWASATEPGFWDTAIWKTLFARSTAKIVDFMADSSFGCHQRLWHIDAAHSRRRSPFHPHPPPPPRGSPRVKVAQRHRETLTRGPSASVPSTRDGGRHNARTRPSTHPTHHPAQHHHR